MRKALKILAVITALCMILTMTAMAGFQIAPEGKAQDDQIIQPVPAANRSIESPLPAFIVARPRITEVPLYPCESSRCIGATYTYVLLVLIGRQTDSRSSARGCTDWKVFTFQGAWHGVPFTYKGGLKIQKIYQFQKNIF